MTKYRCINKECKSYNKVIESNEVWLRVNKEGNIIDMLAPCPNCKKIRELVEVNETPGGFCTTAHGGNGNICNK